MAMRRQPYNLDPTEFSTRELSLGWSEAVRSLDEYLRGSASIAKHTK